MAPHAPDPGCPRINAMCYPAGAVKFREILKNHRENQGQVPKACGVNDINMKKGKGKGKVREKVREREQGMGRVRMPAHPNHNRLSRRQLRWGIQMFNKQVLVLPKTFLVTRATLSTPISSKLCSGWACS